MINTIVITTVLVLIVIMIILQFANYFLMNSIFKQENTEETKLSFWNKIKWLKANRSGFSENNTQRMNRFIRQRKLEIGVTVVTVALYFAALIFGWV